jgi:hypothetical protein
VSSPVRLTLFGRKKGAKIVTQLNLTVPIWGRLRLRWA